MNKNIFTVLLVAVLTAGYVQAQFTFGVRAGYNLTTVAVKFDGERAKDTDYKSKSGFQAGVVGEYSFSEKFAIQPAILFATQGSKTAPKEFLMGDMWMWESITAHINYLQIPVNAQYKIDLGDLGLLFQAGPYLGYALGGYTKWEFYDRKDATPSGGEKTTIKFGSEEEQTRPFDFGLGLGAALQMENLQLGCRYQFGLANVCNLKETIIHHRGFAITTTWMFGK